MIDAPVISHWRNIYFRPEGHGLVCGNHHHALQPDDYEPTGGVIDTGGGATVRVGLDQVMLDSVVALMPRFPVLTSNGLNLGRTPADIPGGAYYMNPEELPFEGEVPGTDGSVFYAGSGCGTGFKLGPGVAWLAVERLMGVPREERLIASPLAFGRARRVLLSPGHEPGGAAPPLPPGQRGRPAHRDRGRRHRPRRAALTGGRDRRCGQGQPEAGVSAEN